MEEIDTDTNTGGTSGGSSSSGRESLESEFNEIRQEYLQARLGVTGLREKLLGKTKSSTNSYSDKSNPIISQNTKSIYEITVGHRHPNQLHPPVQYRIAFVKQLIKQLELEMRISGAGKSDDEFQEDDETSSLWYDALESLTRLGEQSESFYRIYELPGNCGVVKVFENEVGFVTEGTTGLVTWEASVELSKWLCSGNEAIKVRKWILELGCGCGLLAVSALKALPHLSKYLASDGHFSAVEKCKANLHQNFGTLKTDVTQVEQIDWVKDEEKFKKVVKNLTEGEGPGVLLGADIVFDPSLIPSLVGLIDVFLKAHEKSLAFLACTVRNAETLDVLKIQLEKRMIKFEEVHQWGNQKGVVYQLNF